MLAGTVRAGGASADVWLAWVPRHAADAAELASRLLSGGERERLAQYRNVDAAARYVITRSLARGVLGDLLGIAPETVDIRVTDLGKPVVSDELHFNVSHSGELITLAVSKDRAVGIDIERRREVARAGALIARWMTEGEQREVSALRAAGASESDSFLRVWSAKEARLKALGVGISGAKGSEQARVMAVPLDALFARPALEAAGYFGAVAFA